jgi:tRNA pseudouridine55 synthase
MIGRAFMPTAPPAGPRQPGTPRVVHDGALVIDKPSGMTSHDVVARVRRLTGQSRVGHTGTLDPLATGVLPLVLGRATRLARFLSASSKCYEARVRFGWATTTYDAEGNRTWGTVAEQGIAEAALPDDTRPEPSVPTRDALERALLGFLGDQEQTPPAYSAKKVGGVAAHRLARRQEAVTLAPVRVRVEALRLEAYDRGVADLTLTCSAGFYVRSLAHDLGAALACGAHLLALRRTRSGTFSLSDAVTLEVAAERWAEAVLPLDRLLPEMPAVRLRVSAVDRVRHGREVREQDVEGWLSGSPDDAGAAAVPAVRVLDPAGRLVAVAHRSGTDDGWPLHPGIVLA